VLEFGSSVEAVRAVRFYMSLKHASNYIGVSCPNRATGCSPNASNTLCACTKLYGIAAQSMDLRTST
jgi:hypothetical protein